MASSRVCSIDTCKRTARALCYCCQQNLCLDHLKEHSDLLNRELSPLADQINQLSDQFNNIFLHQPAFFTELDQWRTNAHREIDRFCGRKKQEFDELINRERKKCKVELDQLRDQVNQLIWEQDATREHIDSVNHSVRSLQQQTNRLDSLSHP